MKMNHKKLFLLIIPLLFVSIVSAVDMDPNFDYSSLCSGNDGCFDPDGEDYYTAGKSSKCQGDGSATIFDQCLSSTKVEETVCKNGELETIGYECPYKCKWGACLLASTTCEDSDGGINLLKKGKLTGTDEYNEPYEKSDSCEGSKIKEFYCENGRIKSTIGECPNGYSCAEGECIKDAYSHLLVVDDKAPSSDVIILTDLGIHLKYLGYDNIAPSKLNSEVTKDMLHNRVTTFIYLGEAVIIVGKNSPSEHNTLANIIEDFLEDEKDIKVKTISSSQVRSDDLRDLFPDAIKEEDEEEEEEKPGEIAPPPQKDECTSDSDCDDNNACTTDLCSGTPKKCSNTETAIGCNYNKKCIPIGIRVFNEYCDIDKQVYTQKDKEEPCKNNYECASNLCVNDLCVSPSLIQRIMNFFKGLVGNAVKIVY